MLSPPKTIGVRCVCMLWSQVAGGVIVACDGTCVVWDGSVRLCAAL
jgi:hypothetical protein